MMKRTFLLKPMLLLFALIAGVGSVWGETLSVNITPTQALNDGGVDPITIVCAKGDGTSNPAISSGQLRLYQAASGKTTGNTITFSSEKTITSIVFTFANDMTADNGVFSEGSYDSETSTWTGSTNSVTLTVTGTKSGERIYITAMTVYYEDDGGDTPIPVSTYNVTLPEADECGTYTMDTENPVATGTQVTLTYTPAAGYENYQATWSINGTAIAGNKFSMPDEDVTVTVALAEVQDYVTLPFSWEGGTKADLLAIEGITASGLGDDYAASNAPYRVKLDTTGDYIQIKTDGQPGKVIIGVKMLGGSNTSSITVKGSSNGEDFSDVQTLSISGSQNDVLTLETTNAFAATDRYVRLVFTKGSNVGVGSITIAIPSTDPEIVADAEVELAADATSGEIAYTVNNAVEGTTLTATTTADWISNVTVAADKVTFTTTANEGAERTATITLTYGEYATKEITVTQAAYVAPLTAVTDYMWTFEDWDNGDIVATTIIDNLEVNASSNKKISIDENSKSIDGYDFTKRLKLGGSGSTTERNVHFKVAGNSTITIYGMSGSSGNTRTIQVNIGNTVVAELTNDGTAIGKVEYNYTGEETDVYVYSSNSGNNIYGIKVEPYDASEPSVSVENNEIDVEAEGGDGTIAVTYNNITDIVADVAFYEADGTTEASYEWLQAEVDNDENVYYVVDANTGDARTAYMKVYALVGESYVYSDLISITQAKYVAPFEGATYTLATSITPGKSYIIVSEVDLEGNAYAMGVQNNNNRAAVAITVDGTTAQVSSDDVREFVISIPEGEENYTIYDETEEGYLYASSSSSNHLRTQTTLNDNGKWKITFDTEGVASVVAQGSSSRNVMQYNTQSTLFACYASASQGPVYLYEKDDKTDAVSASVSEYKWASFSSDKAVDFTEVEGLTAYIVTGAEGNTITTQEVSGAVKAGTGLLLYSETAGSFEIPVAEEGEDYSNTNKLVAVTADNTVIGKADDGYTNYILVVQNETAVFAYIDSHEATLDKGKAYLCLSGDVTTAPFLSFDGAGTTSISEEVREKSEEAVYYDLSGRRVVKPTKGVFIVNGKKVILK